MAKRNTIEMNLPTVDELFSTQEERDNEKREYVKAIPLDQIYDFPNHPFKVRMDEKMLEMIESVREYGVLSPAVVRPKEDGTYEMIAGHRRKLASQMADRSDMPCIVRNLTDEEATIIMVDSNLQREEILPSEKAFAYKMKLDAMENAQKEAEKEFPQEQELAEKSARLAEINALLDVGGQSDPILIDDEPEEEQEPVRTSFAMER